jgi:predicted RNase H-like HicB family nuclease
MKKTYTFVIHYSMMKYTVILEPDDEGKGFTVEVPALPGCITEGDNIEDALSNAKEAIELFIETLKEIGKPIPEDVPVSDIRTVEISA